MTCLALRANTHTHTGMGRWIDVFEKNTDFPGELAYHSETKCGLEPNASSEKHHEINLTPDTGPWFFLVGNSGSAGGENRQRSVRFARCFPDPICIRSANISGIAHKEKPRTSVRRKID